MAPRIEQLETPPLPLLVPASVFDAFGWQPSSLLEWRTPGSTIARGDLDPELPLGFAFVLRQAWGAVPTELARLHVGRGYDLGDELCLAPYGIDDATDQLFAHRRPAREVFFLAADNLNALFWALHDWSHFHNHGPFDERTATELQCDAAALAWLWKNRARLPLPDDDWEQLRAAVVALHERRLRDEPPGVALDDDVLRDPRLLQRLVA